MKIEPVYYWPRWFRETLPKSEQVKIKSNLISQLSRGQLYLWRALNIYDDLLDNEGQASELPRANGYYRRFLEIYYRLNLSADFYDLFDRTLNDLDRENRRETLGIKLKIKNGRSIIPKKLPPVPSLISLSKKSLALALGPSAILAYLGYDSKSYQRRNLLNFFRSALAAKQLADDAHDWLADLQSGKITAANVLILKAARRRRLALNLKQQPTISHLLFAENTPLINNDLVKLCQQARGYAKKMAWPANNKLIGEIIIPLEKAAQKALDFQKLLA